MHVGGVFPLLKGAYVCILWIYSYIYIYINKSRTVLSIRSLKAGISVAVYGNFIWDIDTLPQCAEICMALMDNRFYSITMGYVLQPPC